MGICTRLLAGLSALEDLARENQQSLPKEWVENERIGEHDVEFAVISRDLDGDETLIVIRAFVHTLRSANYLALGAVGHVRADGFVVTTDGKVTEAPDEML
jgi:hypothetical protein